MADHLAVWVTRVKWYLPPAPSVSTNLPGRSRLRSPARDHTPRVRRDVARTHVSGAVSTNRSVQVMPGDDHHGSAGGTPVPAIARLVTASEGAVREVIHGSTRSARPPGPSVGGGCPAGSALRMRSSSSRRPPRVPGKLGRPFSWWSLRRLVGYLARSLDRIMRIGRERLRQILRGHGISFQRRQTARGDGPVQGPPACGGVPHRTCRGRPRRRRLPVPARGCRRRAARTADPGQRPRGVPRPAAGEAAGRPIGAATSSPGPAGA